MIRLGIIIGSTREGRFADHPANWIAAHVARREGVEAEILDLRDYPMPFFDEPGSSLFVPSKNEVARRWQQKLDEFDGFIITAAEYNRGPTAVLKNALDYAYSEYNKKPVGFVGYGGVGGARAVEQLRLHAVELQMAPIRSAVHIQMGDYLAVVKEGKKLSDFKHLEDSAKSMLDQLEWWATALKTARERDGLKKAA